MNTISKIVALASLCLLTGTVTKAQNLLPKEELSSTARLQKKWFDYDEDKARYQFTIALDKDESLTIRFRTLSEWTSVNDFMNAFAATDKVMAAYKDSLLQEQYTQVLNVHIPVNQKNIIARFSQYNESANLMTINSDGAAALKLGMDTLNVLQLKAGIQKIQYRFILKKLGNYTAYAQDEYWKNKTAAAIDSIVNEYRRKWKKPDAPGHGLTVSYNPMKNESSVSQGRPLKQSVLLIEAGIGVSLIRNTLCPNVDYGIGIRFNKDKEEANFLRVSASGFYRFAETSPNKFKGYPTTFINLEFGSESTHNNPHSFFYKTSLGIGYKLLNKKEEDRDPTISKQMYRLFFNYSLNKFLVITPEFVTNFKKGDKNDNWFGLSVNLRIL